MLKHIINKKKRMYEYYWKFIIIIIMCIFKYSINKTVTEKKYYNLKNENAVSLLFQRGRTNRDFTFVPHDNRTYVITPRDIE